MSLSEHIKDKWKAKKSKYGVPAIIIIQLALIIFFNLLNIELLLFAVKCNSHSQTLVNTTAKIQTIFQTAKKKVFFQKHFVRMIDTICLETIGICRTFVAENKS